MRILFPLLKYFNKQQLLQVNYCEIYHPDLQKAEQPSSVLSSLFLRLSVWRKTLRETSFLCTYENKLDSWQIINLYKVAGIRGICFQTLP